MTEELKESADRESSSTTKVQAAKKRSPRRSARADAGERPLRRTKARQEASVVQEAGEGNTPKAARTAAPRKPRRQPKSSEAAATTSSAETTVSAPATEGQGAPAEKPAKPRRNAKSHKPAAGKKPNTKGERGDKNKKPQKGVKEKNAGAKKSVTKMGPKGAAAEGKIEKSEKSRVSAARPAKRREPKRPNKWDDNYGNSIYYQPKRQNLRTLRSDQPMHWEPVDPYHPSSQALSLPQTMPDDDFPMRSRGPRGNRGNAKPAKKRFRSNRGDR